MGKRAKPHDPAKATQAALERREREAEVARLISMGATVSTDRAGKIISARRSNVFTLLLARNSITQNQYDAAYRLAQDWAAWKGLDGKGERSEFVDGGTGSAELVTDRMIQAGKRIWGDGTRVVGVMQEIEPHHVPLLCAFMVATVEEDRPMAWRGIVERSIGVTVRDRQTEAVVDALEALRAVYETPRRVAA